MYKIKKICGKEKFITTFKKTDIKLIEESVTQCSDIIF